MSELLAGAGQRNSEYRFETGQSELFEAAPPQGNWIIQIKSSVAGGLAEVNKELWLILSLLLIAGIMNYLVTAHPMLLGFYTLPTLFSGYFYG
jgi:hypothetical protein